MLPLVSFLGWQRRRRAKGRTLYHTRWACTIWRTQVKRDNERQKKYDCTCDPIQERRQEGALSCLDLPASAFADPRLLSACPHCQHPLQFNPFFAAADNYAEILRHGLEQSRREKGDDHEETLAHLAALAAHYEQLGQPEAARPFAEEHARLGKRE